MIITYELVKDGELRGSWSKSFENAACLQMQREEEVGIWELFMVLLDPKTLEQKFILRARREVKSPPPKPVMKTWKVTYTGNPEIEQDFTSEAMAWRAFNQENRRGYTYLELYHEGNYFTSLAKKTVEII